MEGLCSNNDKNVSEIIFITKSVSKYELEIYENENIKNSTCFPKCFGRKELPESEEIEYKFEKVASGYEYEKYQIHARERWFNDKILVDLFGALTTLHSAGYVHGDVSPGNVGYNAEKGLWQLIDFDNSRPIEEAAKGTGKYHYTKRFASKHYLETGIYRPFDDFIVLIQTLNYIYNFIPGNLDSRLFEIMDLFKDRSPFEISKLKDIYFDSATVLWELIQDKNDPSIKNAQVICKSYL